MIRIILVLVIIFSKSLFADELKSEWFSCNQDSDCIATIAYQSCDCEQTVNKKYEDEYYEFALKRIKETEKKEKDSGSYWECEICPPPGVTLVPACKSNKCISKHIYK